MKDGTEYKRLRYVKICLYSSFFISFLLILGSAASVFGYKNFAPGFEFVSLLGGLIGVQISIALLLMIQDLEGKQFKETSDFGRKFIIGLALALSLGALFIWVFEN